VERLGWNRLDFRNGKAIIGDFTNVYHWDHAEGGIENFTKPPIAG
jgi:hypothetical protein